MQTEFDNLISSFTKLPTSEKPKEIINTLKQNIALIEDLNEKFEGKSQMLINKDMSTVTKENLTEDDCYNAIFAYIKSLENSTGELLISLSDLLDAYINN